MMQMNYNPDILTCLASLSNDEVFTPPKIVNEMLDLLPKEIWNNKDAKFLDPVSKTGVFLREIAKRLNKGLEKKIPDKQKRINHIFGNQLFAISITELTSLISRRSAYCSKDAKGKYSICSNFKNHEGNIRFFNTEHTFKNGRCIYCGASEEVYSRGEELESHAYEFIHTLKPEEIFKMKFDVIVGNPPYQLSDGGAQASAIPLYHKFVEQAKKLNPRFLTMIIPSRWFAGGKGLDEFRDKMLKDKRIRILHDFWLASECFPGIKLEGGVCYFLWDRDNSGKCKIISHEGNEIVSEMERELLDDKNSDSFIRFNKGISLYNKVKDKKEESFSRIISSRKPFDLPTNFNKFFPSGDKDSIKMYGNKMVGYLSKDFQINQNKDLIKKWKVFISYAYGMGSSFPSKVINKPFVGEPNSICTETYLLIGPFDKKEIAENVVSYMNTNFFRALVLLKKNTQHGTAKVYSLVPIQDFSKSWTDEELYKKYGLNEEEIAFIEKMIRPMDLNNNSKEEELELSEGEEDGSENE